MFPFFPDNYMWSQATARVLSTGGSLGEAAATIAQLSNSSQDNMGDTWFSAWNSLAERVWDYGTRELQSGHSKSAGQTFLRACSYFQWSVTFMAHTDNRRPESHERSIAAFQKFASSTDPRIERIELPFENESYLPGWFVPGKGAEVRKPTALFLSGIDATKEQGYPFAQELASRGFNVFLVDGPGVVEALLKFDLRNRYDEEVPGGVFIDYLLTRSDVDASRVAVVGVSMGAYRAARLTAFDDRVKAMVAWGAQWDGHESIKARLESSWQSSSATVEHYLHVYDAQRTEELLDKLKNWRLESVAPRISCPILITHGIEDKQTPVRYAYSLYESVSSDRKELKIFTADTGGTQHCQNDNRLLAYSYVSDWLVDTLIRDVDRRGKIAGWTTEH